MSTLSPYNGEWDSSQASFLLGRTIFGRTQEQINEVVSLGLEGSLDKLFEEKPTPAPPIHHKFENDPVAPVGTTWVDKYYPKNDVQGLRNARRNSVIIWQTGLLQESGLSLLEKMVLFWHEHFPVSDINLGEVSFQYLSEIRAHALGNFRSLTEAMTISPAMLVFLNGNQNNKESPNENYARELMELFTIGRGDAVGDGDYTNYTETDIVALAKALTGWKARIAETGYAESFFVKNKHDVSDKQLSHRFDNAVISNEDEEEYKKVIDIILAKKEVAHFICRKLHIWFVGSDINDDVEANIIGPMADIMFENNYDIKIPLRTLLASEYFHDEVHRGCMLSSPLDFLYKSINSFGIIMPEDEILKYYLWEGIANAGALLEMIIMDAPSVAGWKAYYQEPGYYQFWINSVTLGFREQVAEVLIIGNDIRGFRLGIDALGFISKIDNATDPNELIKNIAELIFEFPLSQNQSDYLKEVLIPGLPDFEWTVEYGKYLENPEDIAVKISVYTKVATLLLTMMKMPEYYLM